MKGRALFPVENFPSLQFSSIIICVEVFSQMSMFPKLVGSNCLFVFNFKSQEEASLLAIIQQRDFVFMTLSLICAKKHSFFSFS